MNLICIKAFRIKYNVLFSFFQEMHIIYPEKLYVFLDQKHRKMKETNRIENKNAEKKMALQNKRNIFHKECCFAKFLQITENGVFPLTLKI